MADQNEMDKVIEPMLEHVCDKLCRFPWEITDQEEMSRICHECELEKYVEKIKDTYNVAGQLQAAAEVVRNELLQKGDWYRALVESIEGYLLGIKGSVAIDQTARELANRIVGIEPEN